MLLKTFNTSLSEINVDTREWNRMSKIFGTTVKVFTVATVILAIAIAYVLGEMSGELSERIRFNELENKLHPEIHGDLGLYEPPPLWYPLLTTAFIFGASWIVIAVIALTQKIKKRT